jgi:hypothetical protein
MVYISDPVTPRAEKIRLQDFDVTEVTVLVIRNKSKRK